MKNWPLSQQDRFPGEIECEVLTKQVHLLFVLGGWAPTMTAWQGEEVSLFSILVHYSKLRSREIYGYTLFKKKNRSSEARGEWNACIWAILYSFLVRWVTGPES